MGPLITDFDSCEYETSGIPYVPAVLVVPLPAEDPPEEPPAADSTASDQKPSNLPRFWRQSIDDRGRTYYYHVRLRLPQWEPPCAEDDSPEFSSEEEEEEDQPVPSSEEPVVTVPTPTVVNSRELERMRRRSLLCHERIISPRSEFERSEDAQRYRELKERVLRLKLVRIRERGLCIEEPLKPNDKTRGRDRDKRKLSEKEKEKLRKRAKEKHKRAILKVEASRKRPKEKEKVDPTATGPTKDETRVNGDDKAPVEGNAEEEGVDKEAVMDGSMDDELMNLHEGEDEAGEKERNRNVSANTVRKIKDAFRLKISSDIVNILNPYRRPDCKLGRISSNDDFKHLARKVAFSFIILLAPFNLVVMLIILRDNFQMTHFVLAKELKHCRNIEELVVNESVKHKAKDFIKKYMTKFGPVYKRGTDDDI